MTVRIHIGAAPINIYLAFSSEKKKLPRGRNLKRPFSTQILNARPSPAAENPPSTGDTLTIRTPPSHHMSNQAMQVNVIISGSPVNQAL